MKKIIFVLAMIIANYVTEAQVKTPQPSPKSTIMQVVGLTNVEIVYSRPSAKGRDVFNNLVKLSLTRVVLALISAQQLCIRSTEVSLAKSIFCSR